MFCVTLVAAEAKEERVQRRKIAKTVEVVILFSAKNNKQQQ